MNRAHRVAVLATSLGLLNTGVASSCPHDRLLQPYVQTIAGNGSDGTGDGPAGRASFLGPAAVALGPDGSVYVADEFAQNIRRIHNGVVQTVAGLSTPGVTPQERVGGYIDGAAGTAKFGHPHGIAVGRDGTIYVADEYNRVIRKISHGIVSTFAGSRVGSADGVGRSAQFMDPRDIAIDGDGNLYVADNGVGVRKITPNGSVSTLSLTDDKNVCGIAARGSGADTIVAVSDSMRIVIQQGDFGGPLPYVELTEPQDAETGPGFACRLAIYDRCTVVVSDPLTGSIKFERARIGAPVGTGAIYRILVSGRRPGSNVTSGFSDGPSSRALADEPSGVAITAENSVVFADTGNRRVRMVRDVDPRGVLYPDLQGLAGPSSDYRIAFIGDSFNYYNVMWNESMQGQVEAGLAAHGRGVGLNKCPYVVALRFSGISIFSAIDIIKSYLSSGEVDLVIFPVDPDPFTLDQQKHPELTSDALGQRIAHALANLQSSLQANGTKLLLVPIPYGPQISPLERIAAPGDFSDGFAKAEHFEDLLASSGVPTLKLAGPMERFERSPNRVPLYELVNSHPSPEGFTWIGNAILRYLEQWKPWAH